MGRKSEIRENRLAKRMPSKAIFRGKFVSGGRRKRNNTKRNGNVLVALMRERERIHYEQRVILENLFRRKKNTTLR